MIVENPEVTLKEEAHLLPEEALPTAMMDWQAISNVQGDDGEQYMIGFGAIRAWGVDLWNWGVHGGKGKVVQPPGSVYKIAEFPQGMEGRHIYPEGSLTVKRSDHEVAVDLADYHITIKNDHTWNFSVEDNEKGFKAEFVHAPIGYPTWYGKEKPQVYTPHTISYGYFWAGRVEGTLTFEGRIVRIKGAGVRERYYAVDTCPVEVGGWHDWVWFHFDEAFGTFNEMKLTNHKDMSIYLVDEKQFIPAGSFDIEHNDWAYLPQAGVFIPTRYKVTMETKAGVLELASNAVGCHSWAERGVVPDSPTISLNWDIEGIFTYKNGKKKKLTNGRGGTLIRQWKPYPNIFVPQIAGAGVTKAADEFHPV